MEKLLQKFVAHILTFLLAPFVHKLVNYSRHSESLLEEFEIDDIFLGKQLFVLVQAFFKDSLCLENFNNLDAKGTKEV